jgi:hypothetical protein
MALIKTKGAKLMAAIAKILAGLVGVLVSLSVGAGMANKVLTLESLYIPVILTVIAGWIIIVGTILSLVMVLFGE